MGKLDASTQAVLGARCGGRKCSHRRWAHREPKLCRSGESSLATSDPTHVANMALGKRSKLREQPQGYSGTDDARESLNEMICEIMGKYGAEIARHLVLLEDACCH